MASLATIFLPVLVFIGSVTAQQPDDEAPVPADFPKAFITAMAVGVVCVVVFLTLVCVLAHCWQYTIGRGWDKLTGTSERWVDPVFEWPQQLNPRSRNNKKRERKQRQGQEEIRNTASREVMLREWV
ncbi:hypothetical protein F5Y05DRAFT_415899 [Hypoxylon sp. FL0543]|nr:hypothetical protein F5Y05DRAFT_415899 [Hypoxylon sp. FL0543]